MTNTLARSLEISYDNTDPLVLKVIRKVDAIAHKHNTSYFLAGATAREIILRMSLASVQAAERLMLISPSRFVIGGTSKS